ncbi:MAG: hypothetical protein JOZ21_12730 [Verrucomicrobia bacterium]|nr:hypothetical protein [Verrucomicrobiota bacterium]
MGSKTSFHRKSFRFIYSLTAFCLGCLFSGALFLSSASISFAADPATVANIDAGLRNLVDYMHNVTQQTSPSTSSLGNFSSPMPKSDDVRLRGSVRFDEQGRVLVHVHLDGTQSIPAIERALNSLNAKVLDKMESYRHGVVAAYLPLVQIETLARTGGVSHLTAEHPPKAWVGKVTSQGTVVLRTDQVNKLGFKGDGITVGVLSDSFNTAYLNTQNPPATTAQQDAATGDLPKNVNVLQDFTNSGLGGTDEGRAMCQIVYDEAPHCNLAFATAFASEIGFANNIVALRTQANCDVIVDDVSYSDEPVFSDGYLAQAVNLVVNSTDAPGKKVVYCSAAGNAGDNGYRHPFEAIPDAKVRAAGGHGNLKLAQVSESLTAGGWHNWNPNPGPLEPSTDVTNLTDPTGQYQLFLQWDDAFDLDHGITTDFNLLVFDQDGNFLPALSGTVDAFAMKEAYQQAVGLVNGPTYQIAITRSKKTDPKAPAPPPQHQLALLTFSDGQLIGTHFHAAPLDVPNVYGHAAANGAIAVAAYVYDWTDSKPYQPQIEYYTSPGPVNIYFDESQNRLATPQLRAKPDVAGVDGVATTFFGQQYFSTPFAFFGTSAAAPSVAGVAALMIDAAGGPRSIDASTVLLILQGTAPPRDLSPLFAQAVGAGRSGFVTVSALGDVSNNPDYFTVTYIGQDNEYLDTLTIDGQKAGLIFDTSAHTSPALEISNTVGINPSDITFEPTGSPGLPNLVLKFKPGTFKPGDALTFVLDQDLAKTGTFGGSSDSLKAGATFTATVKGSVADTISASFFSFNGLGTGYNQPDGFGLVDALNSVESILESPATSPSTPLAKNPPGASPGVPNLSVER